MRGPEPFEPVEQVGVDVPGTALHAVDARRGRDPFAYGASASARSQPAGMRSPSRPIRVFGAHDTARRAADAPRPGARSRSEAARSVGRQARARRGPRGAAARRGRRSSPRLGPEDLEHHRRWTGRRRSIHRCASPRRCGPRARGSGAVRAGGARAARIGGTRRWRRANPARSGAAVASPAGVPPHRVAMDRKVGRRHDVRPVLEEGALVPEHPVEVGDLEARAEPAPQHEVLGAGDGRSSGPSAPRRARRALRRSSVAVVPTASGPGRRGAGRRCGRARGASPETTGARLGGPLGRGRRRRSTRAAGSRDSRPRFPGCSGSRRRCRGRALAGASGGARPPPTAPHRR